MYESRDPMLGICNIVLNTASRSITTFSKHRYLRYQHIKNLHINRNSNDNTTRYNIIEYSTLRSGNSVLASCTIKILRVV